MAHLLLCNLIIRKFLNFLATYFTHINMFNSHRQRNSQVDPNFFLKPFKLSVSDISQQSFTTQHDRERWLWIIQNTNILYSSSLSPWWFHMPRLASPFPRQQTEENSTLLAGKSVCSSICSCLPSLYFQQTLFWNGMLCFSTGLHGSAIQIPTAITFFPHLQVPLQQFLCNCLTIAEYWTDLENCINTSSYFPAWKKTTEFMILYVCTYCHFALHDMKFNVSNSVPQDPSIILRDLTVHSLFQIISRYSEHQCP